MSFRLRARTPLRGLAEAIEDAVALLMPSPCGEQAGAGDGGPGGALTGRDSSMLYSRSARAPGQEEFDG